MKRLTSIIVLFSFCLIAYNQVIKGTIFDSKTKTPIYSASVYFNGTFAGTLSDQNGNFQIDITKYRSMPLTISAIGYYSATLTDFSSGKPISIYMNPKLFELNEVTVNAKSHPMQRNENLTIFRNEFLGTTGNSMNCVISNEDDIRFKYSSDKDTLKAFAVNPILISNKALGYQITYYLDKFEYVRESKTFSFKGNIIFKEDSTAKESKKQYYERKRKIAYLGSRMHFFRSLWVDNLNAAGFTVKNPANETMGYKKIVFQKDNHTKYIRYPAGLGISYYTKQPTSFIIFLKTDVFFDSNGYYDASGISWEGEMARQRIADLVPYEYSTKE
jgi:hypothetical protein